MTTPMKQNLSLQSIPSNDNLVEAMAQKMIRTIVIDFCKARLGLSWLDYIGKNEFLQELDDLTTSLSQDFLQYLQDCVASYPSPLLESLAHKTYQIIYRHSVMKSCMNISDVELLTNQIRLLSIIFLDQYKLSIK